MPRKRSESWPFDQPPNCATITTRQVMERSEPILLVSHDEDDHGWQFIGSSDVRMEDMLLVALQEIVEIDPSVLDVADLPPGWQAFRDEATGEWTRAEHPPIAEEDQ